MLFLAAGLTVPVAEAVRALTVNAAGRHGRPVTLVVARSWLLAAPVLWLAATIGGDWRWPGRWPRTR